MTISLEILLLIISLEILLPKIKYDLENIFE